MHLDPLREKEHRYRNQLHTAVLLLALCGLVSILGYLLWGSAGAVGVLIAVIPLAVLAPRVPGEVVMRLYRAREISGQTGAQLRAIIGELTRRAELPVAPRLFVVPSNTLNAFATGHRDRAVIAVTEGLLRKLSMRELVGVLAHEVSHVRNNDLAIMGVADVMSRVTQAMSFLGVALLLWHLPSVLTGGARVPWLAILLLYLAPTIASLLQLGLSRAREYDADLEGAMLTGDPEGLASALSKLERYQGSMWEDLVLTGRRVPQPSVLRSHPETSERVKRLLELVDKPGAPPIEVREEPMITMVGVGPITMRPRFRASGLWY